MSAAALASTSGLAARAPASLAPRPAPRAWAPPPRSTWLRRACQAAPTHLAAPARPTAAGAARSGGVAEGTGSSDNPSRDFASSLALMVLGAALVSERINGQGIVACMELDHPHIEPLLWGIAGVLAVVAAWPSRAQPSGTGGLLRALTGRLAFAGLSAALVTELWTGNGLLALLEIETGAEALSEAEAVLAAAGLLILTGPRKAQS